MKKLAVLFLTFLFVILLSSCSSQDNPGKSKDEIEREKRKGYTELKVYQCFDDEEKSLVQHDMYDEKGNILTRKIRDDIFMVYIEHRKYMNEFNKYNENNLLVESVLFDTEGKKYKYTTIIYNDNNVMVEKVSEFYLRDISKYTYKYDDKGNEISYTYHDDNKLFAEMNFSNQYNNKNQLIQKRGIGRNYNSNGQLDEAENLIVTYTYDKKGNKTSEHRTYINGSKEYSNILNYKYNDKGLVIESSKPLIPEYTATQNLYHYLPVGLLDDIQHFNNLGKNYNYKYNDKCLIFEQDWGHEITNYKYNEKGLITEITFGREQSEPTFIYEYK